MLHIIHIHTELGQMAACMCEYEHTHTQFVECHHLRPDTAGGEYV